MFRKGMVAVGAVLGACVAVTPVSVEAQAKTEVHRIGMLWAGTKAENNSRRAAVLERLHELGWDEGRTITLVERWADGHYERLPALASELVSLKVELIMAQNGTPSALAAMGATKDVPIVAPSMSDPVANRLVASLAHPGGNVTGSTIMASELYPKRIALLKQVLPEVTRVALLMNNGNPFSAEAERLSQAAGRSLKLDIEVFDVRYPEDFEKAFEKMANARAQAVVVGTDILFQARVSQLGVLALKYRLPLVAGYHAPGVLIAYNVDNVELYRRAASYVDKILKGAKAADLPIEQPTNIKLFVDLKTAKALGVTIPQPVMLRADEVIQ